MSAIDTTAAVHPTADRAAVIAGFLKTISGRLPAHVRLHPGGASDMTTDARSWLHMNAEALGAELAALLPTAEGAGWEYAWEADEAIRATMSPRGPRFLLDGYPDTPEALASFPRGKRIRRRRAGDWEDVVDGT